MARSPLGVLRRAFHPVLPASLRGGPAVVPVVRLQGAIGVGTPLRPALTLASLAEPLERAFSVAGAAEVALVINSPGGSPAQSHLIYRRIRRLAEEKKRAVTAFVEDAAASGGYMLACAADTIIVDPSSIVGSIGVISAGFGFEGLLQRFGVERRVHTAGTRKSLLDPFLPEAEDDVRRLLEIQREIHRVFIELVRTRRGARLNGTDEELFSGDFWIGEHACTRGMADEVGDLHSTMHTRYGNKVDLRLINQRRGGLRRLTGMAAPGGLGSIGADLLASLEERALWARYGL
jgi:signal peptide peptidase SppA